MAADKWTFHYPISTTLAQEWATRFKYPLDDSTSIERVAQFVSVYIDKSWPRDTIARQLAEADPPDLTPENETHRVLAELGLPVYITSNFDDYLERALLKEDKDVHVSICRWNKYIPPDAPAYDPDPAKRDPVSRYAIVAKGEDGTLTYRTADDSYNPTVANPLVYHIHGHMQWPASLVVTEDDYFEFLLNLAKDWPRGLSAAHSRVFRQWLTSLSRIQAERLGFSRPPSPAGEYPQRRCAQAHCSAAQPYERSASRRDEGGKCGALFGEVF